MLNPPVCTSVRQATRRQSRTAPVAQAAAASVAQAAADTQAAAQAVVADTWAVAVGSLQPASGSDSRRRDTCPAVAVAPSWVDFPLPALVLP